MTGKREMTEEERGVDRRTNGKSLNLIWVINLNNTVTRIKSLCSLSNQDTSSCNVGSVTATVFRKNNPTSLGLLIGSFLTIWIIVALD